MDKNYTFTFHSLLTDCWLEDLVVDCFPTKDSNNNHNNSNNNAYPVVNAEINWTSIPKKPYDRKKDYIAVVTAIPH